MAVITRSVISLVRARFAAGRFIRLAVLILMRSSDATRTRAGDRILFRASSNLAVSAPLPSRHVLDRTLNQVRARTGETLVFR